MPLNSSLTLLEDRGPIDLEDGLISILVLLAVAHVGLMKVSSGCGVS